MKILSIETSCDETAISILEVLSEKNSPSFSILADETHSQVALHAKYGGVYPALAKREHAKNIPVILEKVLKDARMFEKGNTNFPNEKMKSILEREPELFSTLFPLLSSIQKPDIDHIVVTTGPGLEPTLWIGIMFARALSLAWNIGVTPVNHMEGHLLSVLIDNKKDVDQTIDLSNILFPVLGVLISGGHTEFIVTEKIGHYKKIGQTVDDAVGEAFDKVARILDLSYPGGPKISKLAEEGKENPLVTLPRPMLHSGDYSLSFSGLKTAVLYLSQDLKGKGLWDEQIKKDIAKEFEKACAEVLITKARKAIKEYDIKSILIGGGVAANTYIRSEFQKLEIPLLLPKQKLATDNSIMIGIAGYFEITRGKPSYSYGTEKTPDEIKADGNWNINT
jgi:N6-L-threonylcarbamoyladenine synthase